MFKRLLVRVLSLFCLGVLPLAGVEGKQLSASTELSFQEGISLAEVRCHLEEIFDADSEVLSLYDSLMSLINKDLSKESQESLGLAILFIAEKHQGKSRQHSKQEPYICYPLAVAHNMMLHGEIRDPELLIAAILHDAAPNQDPAVLQEIEALFGSQVAILVQELSAYPVSAKKNLQHELMLHAQSQSEEATQVQLAARLYNIQELIQTPPASWSQEQKDHYIEWAEAVVQRFPQSNLAMSQAVEESIQSYWQDQTR